MKGRRARVTVEGWQAMEVVLSYSSSNVVCWGELRIDGWWRWLRDRHGQVVNILVEVL